MKMSWERRAALIYPFPTDSIRPFDGQSLPQSRDSGQPFSLNCVLNGRRYEEWPTRIANTRYPAVDTVMAPTHVMIARHLTALSEQLPDFLQSLANKTISTRSSLLLSRQSSSSICQSLCYTPDSRWRACQGLGTRKALRWVYKRLRLYSMAFRTINQLIFVAVAMDGLLGEFALTAKYV